MLKTLLISRIRALFSMGFRSTRKGKRRSPVFKILIGLFAVYIFACFLFMFGSMFSSISVFGEMGLGWFYFAMAGIVAFALCFIGSAFAVQQQIYDSHDNELLLAMPIPPAYILASRLIALYLLNFAMELLVLTPAAVVWGMRYSFGAVEILLLCVVSLLLPLLSLTFSCIFGWLLTLLLSRVRNKSMVSMVFSLIFLGAYFYVFSGINRYLALFLQHGEQIAGTVRAAIYPAWSFGTVLADGSLSALLGFALCCVLPFLLVYFLLSKSFIVMVTSKRGVAKVKYRAKALKSSSPSKALLQKELRHFFTNGIYIMNAAMGSIFLLVGAGYLLIKQDAAVHLLGNLSIPSGYISAAVAAMLCAMASTNIVSAPSISLEGKNLWLAQSLPVSPKTVLFAKVNCHMAVTLPPVLLAAVVSSVVLKLDLSGILAVILVPSVMTYFCALLGVVMNLHFPRMDYLSDVAAVKQSASSVLTMFSGLGVLVVPAGAYVLWLSDIFRPDVYLFLYGVVLAAGCVWMYLYLKTAGSERFKNL